MQPRLFVLIIFILVVLLATTFFSRPAPKADAQIWVATSIYPLAEFTRHVGGDLVSVVNLSPAGVEPHDFEPTPQTVAAVYQSDLFLYNGGGIDAWATKLAESLEEVPTLQMTSRLSNLLPAIEEEEEEEGVDEHVWLSPKLAQDQVIIIRDALTKLSPEYREVFEQNATVYIQELQSLDQAYQEGLSQCAIRVAVTSHAAYAYLARDYAFEQIAITGLSPEQEPSAGDLARIAEKARISNVKYIFFETLVSPKLAQTLARELGAQTLVFNPLEGLTSEEVTAGKTYISVMRENLINLQTAMSCL